MKIIIHGWKALGAALDIGARTAQKLHRKVPVPRIINNKPVLTGPEFLEWLNQLAKETAG